MFVFIQWTRWSGTLTPHRPNGKEDAPLNNVSEILVNSTVADAHSDLFIPVVIVGLSLQPVKVLRHFFFWGGVTMGDHPCIPFPNTMSTISMYGRRSWFCH